MKSLNHSLFALAVGITSATAFASSDIPVVPASVLSASTNVPEEQKPPVPQESELLMEYGVNKIVEISLGHPNRIVTPFGDPEVTSTSLTSSTVTGECGEVCIKDHVIYVATAKTSPVTMFITDKGAESRALSLTMIPARIPPREISLRLNDSTGYVGIPSKKAEKWEQSQPYVETIRGLFRKLASGEVPQGYSFGKVPQGLPLPGCSLPWAEVDFANGQFLLGHNLSVYVGVATNKSNRPVELDEQLCGGWDVAAVAAWPLTMLEPGQSTEIYLAKKYRPNTSSASKRPSLIRGRN